MRIFFANSRGSTGCHPLNESAHQIKPGKVSRFWGLRLDRSDMSVTFVVWVAFFGYEKNTSWTTRPQNKVEFWLNKRFLWFPFLVSKCTWNAMICHDCIAIDFLKQIRMPRCLDAWIPIDQSDVLPALDEILVKFSSLLAHCMSNHQGRWDFSQKPFSRTGLKTLWN